MDCLSPSTTSFLPGVLCPFTAFELLHQRFFRLSQQEVPHPPGPSPTYLPCVFPSQPPPPYPSQKILPRPCCPPPHPQHFLMSSFPKYSLLFKSWEGQVRPKHPSTPALSTLRCSLGLTHCLLPKEKRERPRLRTQKPLLSETTELPRQ